MFVFFWIGILYFLERRAKERRPFKGHGNPQVQAQMPAFLAEAHAAAEAQEQVQVPHVQVGEVSDVNSNVNNVNSPVVVS